MDAFCVEVVFYVFESNYKNARDENRAQSVS